MSLLNSLQFFKFKSFTVISIIIRFHKCYPIVDGIINQHKQMFNYKVHRQRRMAMIEYDQDTTLTNVFTRTDFNHLFYSNWMSEQTIFYSCSNLTIFLLSTNLSLLFLLLLLGIFLLFQPIRLLGFLRWYYCRGSITVDYCRASNIHMFAHT